jgi:hypothetical protein
MDWVHMNPTGDAIGGSIQGNIIMQTAVRKGTILDFCLAKAS